MKGRITPEMVQEMERLLRRGSRVEVQLEQGKITLVEIKRKLRMKEAGA